MQSISLKDDYSIALPGGLMKQDMCPAPAGWPQLSKLHLCLALEASSAFSFISTRSKAPLHSSLCLQHGFVSLHCSQGHHWSDWVLYSCSLGWAEREIDCSQFSSRLNYIDLSLFLQTGALLPFNYHGYPFSASLEWLGVWDIIWPWEKFLDVSRDFFPHQSGPWEIEGLVLVGQESWREGVPGIEVFPLFTVALSGGVSVTGNALFHGGNGHFWKWQKSGEVSHRWFKGVAPLKGMCWQERQRAIWQKLHCENHCFFPLPAFEHMEEEHAAASSL